MTAGPQLDGAFLAANLCVDLDSFCLACMCSEAFEACAEVQRFPSDWLSYALLSKHSLPCDNHMVGSVVT